MTHGESWYEQKQNIDLSQEFWNGQKGLPKRMSRKDAEKYYTDKIRKYFSGDLNEENIEDVETNTSDDEIPKYKQLKQLEYAWLKTMYWDFEWTDDKIAKHLKVSPAWVFSEIKRLGLVKSENGIKFRGKKGFKLSEEEKIKRQNQPHAKKVNKLDKDGNYIETYRSVHYAARKNNIKNPSNISRAIRQHHRTCVGFKLEYAS